MDQMFYKRFQQMEAMSNSQKAEQTETLKRGYQTACEDGNAEDAAFFARKIRNKLLEESDCRLTLDRLGLKVPGGSTFSSWLSFLRGLGEILTGKWASYRKQLRDLPEQEGFPFEIVFPSKPENEE
ncbi:MAG: hypothetical protein IJT66_06670 [Clostridia bacterium]|nr:hypothetical protein [Clostridia bacterium]